MPSLTANAVWSITGQAAYAASQWGVLMVLARLGSAHQVGIFAFALAVTAPVVLLTNVQLRQLQATDARGDFSFSQYLALRLVAVTVAMTAIICLGIGSASPAETISACLAMGAAKAIEAIGDVVYGLYQRHERLALLGSSMAAKGLAGMAALTAAILAGASVPVAIVCMGLAWLIVLLTLDLPRAIRLVGIAGVCPDWTWRPLKQLLIIALPMGAVACLLSLSSNIPNYAIERSLGHAELGRYAAVWYLLQAGNLVVVALGNALASRLANYFATERMHEYRLLLVRFAAIVTGIALTGLLLALSVGEQVIALVYGPDFAGLGYLLPWVIGAGAVAWLGSVAGYGATAARRLHIQVPLTLASAATCLIACILLVPAHGLIGAAWSSMLAAVVHAVGFTVVTVHASFHGGSRDRSPDNTNKDVA